MTDADQQAMRSLTYVTRTRNAWEGVARRTTTSSYPCTQQWTPAASSSSPFS